MGQWCIDGHAPGVRGEWSAYLESVAWSESDRLACNDSGAAEFVWANPLLMGALKVVIINFYAGNKPSVDVDNMSKPILDEMQQIVYDDDRQIIQAEITHVQIGAAFSIVGVSKILVNALQAGQQFVYLRLEDPVDPLPLPK